MNEEVIARAPRNLHESHLTVRGNTWPGLGWAGRSETLASEKQGIAGVKASRGREHARE